MKKTCLFCAETLNVGRADKKYCNDYCRNSHHNETISREEKEIRPIFNALRKNRKTLLMLREVPNLTMKELYKMGFNFDFATHSRRTEAGEETYCFDVGYRVVNDQRVEIVQERR